MLLCWSYSLMMPTRQKIHTGLPSLCQCLSYVLNTSMCVISLTLLSVIRNWLHGVTGRHQWMSVIPLGFKENSPIHKGINPSVISLNVSRIRIWNELNVHHNKNRPPTAFQLISSSYAISLITNSWRSFVIGGS